MTEARLLEGKPLAQKIQQEIRSEIEGFLKKGLEPPLLTAFEVSDHPASRWYVGEQQKLASRLGIGFQLVPAKETRLPSQLMEQIRKASDSKTHGIFVSLPLPDGFDSAQIFRVFNYQKDVEGVHPTNLGWLVLRKARLVPSTALAALALIDSTGIKFRGKRAVIVGQSAVVGRPLQLLLGERRVTTAVCNTGTPMEDIEKLVSDSDLVVACAGKPGLVQGAWIKPGAVVIDVGTTEVKGKLVGDVEFEEAKKRAGFITPVPGGVGPLTVTILMKNLITAYKWQKGIL
ncbi:MAG: bifunctional 5,10-methylenetetrahydrofolate dehydrogenase/5,10-methenyltetrahydrofolate cyclohydrolase [Candidatus Omnitrophica bacterium]|nr:bifunctional 5,10-methylenetetrahydrofolate dehydrogenase/5,10-methenyltetrahydrofolate cyclohydrolase [Candidatus Omnitrophota bacterium]